MAEILPIRRKTLSNQSINQSINQSNKQRQGKEQTDPGVVERSKKGQGLQFMSVFTLQ